MKAYPLAITLAETIPDVFNRDGKSRNGPRYQRGGDGESGIYPENRIEALSGERKRTWFQKGSATRRAW